MHCYLSFRDKKESSKPRKHKSPKKNVSATTTAGSGANFKSVEFIDEDDSSSTNSDKPLKKKTRKEKAKKKSKSSDKSDSGPDSVRIGGQG